jgi:hypothetical protein
MDYIIPSPQPEVEEAFAAQQISHQFYHEVRARTEFQTYCQWYRDTAAQNRRDLEKMRGELNIMQWFCRR